MHILLDALGVALAVALLVVLWAAWTTRRFLRLMRLTGLHSTAPAPSILGLPSEATLVLGLIDGALTVLIKGVFGLPSTWQYVLSAVAIFLGGAGIQPLLGPAFRSALNLPLWATAAASALMSAASYLLAAPIGIDHTVSIWISGALAFLAAVGFGTTVQSVVAAYRKKGGVIA